MPTPTDAPHKLPPFDGQPLPSPPPINSLGVFGATAAFTALAIGSGEIMFWPGLVTTVGAGVLLIAIMAVLLQWVVNIEIARFSLATGETMGAAVARRSPLLGFLMLLAATVPWIWPGWIRAGGQMLSALTGAPERWLSLATLVLCVAGLTLPRVIFRFVEFVQSIFLAIILLGTAWLAGVVWTSSGGLGAFFAEFLSGKGVGQALGQISGEDPAKYFTLLSGVVFAGAGGILNLGYGYLVAERGSGRAHARLPEQGLAAKRDVITSDPKQVSDTDMTYGNWANWLRTLRTEHALLFAGGNIFSILFLSALFFMIFRGSNPQSGVALLADAFERISSTYGQANGLIFALVGFLVFFTSSLGILDVTSRIAADVASVLHGRDRIAGMRFFPFIILVQAVIAAVLIFVDPRQPFWLISTSAVLNTLAMALYSATIVWLNRNALAPEARPGLVIQALVLVTSGLFLTIFLWTMKLLIFG